MRLEQGRETLRYFCRRAGSGKGVGWVFLLLLAKAEITIKFYFWTCGGGGGWEGLQLKHMKPHCC
jgi:hypothetical protein